MAEFWQYDSRIARRWNIDPRPNRSLSPYQVFANNPLQYTDVKGDTLGVSNNADSRADINSIVSNQNQAFISYNERNGGTLSLRNSIEVEGKIITLQAAMRSDKGLRLLYDLSSSTRNFHYSASNMRSMDWLREGILVESLRGSTAIDIGDEYPSGTIMDDKVKGDGSLDYYKTFVNLSFTLRGDEESKLGGLQQVPNRTYNINDYIRKYDGVVAISPGEFYQERIENGNTIIRKIRSDVVFHELQENLFRVYGSSYEDSHSAALKTALMNIPRIGPLDQEELLKTGSNKTNLGEKYYFIMK